jgi:hypothetical protein
LKDSILRREIEFEGAIVDPNGELHHWDAKLVERYSTPKSLNFKGNLMKMADRQAAICKGPKDILMFWKLLDNLDPNNSFSDPYKLAKEEGWDSARMARFLKRGIDVGMWRRLDRGKYLVNPYTFKGKQTTNETCKKLQQEHTGWPVIGDAEFENYKKEETMNEGNS